MGTGTDFRQSDEQLIQAEIAKNLKVKDGKLYYGKKQIKITLPGKPGEDGKTPKKGVDYHDGKDGVTPKKGKDYRDGKDGITPVKGKDYHDGDPGYTPVKGVDYRDGVDGKSPVHQWKGTKLRFQNPDGTWSEYIDLKGELGKNIKGDSGDVPEHQWNGTLLRFKNPDGTWDKWVDLKGEIGKGKPGKSIKPVKGVDYQDGEPGKDAVLPEAEQMLVLLDVDIVIGATGKAALEKKFQNIKVVKL